MSFLIPITAWMNFPRHRGNKVIDGILRRSHRAYAQAFSARSDEHFWDEQSLGLDRVELFQKAPLAKQKKILAACSQAFLREAFAIERAGMAFASKMVLLSDDLESRILYSQFAAQEASHYQALAAYLPEEPKGLAEDPFLGLLKSCIEAGDRMSLTLVIQVFLEGFGLLHYKKLQKDCMHKGLAEEFRLILQDEANHHGSGVALLDLNEMSPEQHASAVATLEALLGMVAAGPWALATILQNHLSPEESPLRFFEELNHAGETELKLGQLKRILQVGGAAPIVHELEAKNLFQPLPLEALYA